LEKKKDVDRLFDKLERKIENETGAKEV